MNSDESHDRIAKRGPQSSAEVERILETYRGYDAKSYQERKWSEENPGFAEIVRERDAMVDRILPQGLGLPLGDCRLLEVGCGRGGVLTGLRRLGARSAHLYGVDLRPDAIEEARRAYPDCHWEVVNAEGLPFPEGSFDGIVVFTVFSSILADDMAANVAQEIDRVLKPGGGILWYDFRIRNPWNASVRGRGRKNLSVLFPGYKLELRSVTLAPPLARRLGTRARGLYRWLAAVPLLRSHLLGVMKKPR